MTAQSKNQETEPPGSVQTVNNAPQQQQNIEVPVPATVDATSKKIVDHHSDSVSETSDGSTFADCEEVFEDASNGDLSETKSDSGLSSQPDVSNSSDDEDTDAGSEPTLEESLRDITRLLSMALDNQFHEAYRGTEKWSHVSLYHALGKGTLSFLKGCLTLERPEIQRAIDDLRNCVDVCQRQKRHSMTKVVWRPNYDSYTDVEIHAELVYAEALLMTALLTFLQDQNLLNLVRGAFRIRTCYQSYKECHYILENRSNWISDFSRLHFESGVRMGIGTFNLMLSHMPGRVLRLLEFVGFSGNRAQGMTELEISTSLTEGLRCPLAVLIMLVYQTYIEHIFGLGDGDMDCVDKLLDYALKKHPNGAFFLLFLGRKKQLTGQIDEAIAAFERCISSQNEWRQFHNICYWELLWCYAVQCDWNKSAEYADILRRQCRWSPGAYTYQYATFLYMIMIEENRPELREEVEQQLKMVPQMTVRLAGKRIPAEKFSCIQSDKYFAHNGQLLIPAIEFMYIWNIFAVIGQAPNLLSPLLERIEKCLVEQSATFDNDDTFKDDYFRCLLLKGMCLRYLQRSDDSSACFREIIDKKQHISEDDYLIPHASLELGLNYMKSGDFIKAREWLDDAKSYSDYAMETIVHFRIHTAIRQMSLINKQKKKLDMHNQTQEVEVADEASSSTPADNDATPGVMGSIWGAMSWRRWSAAGGEQRTGTPEKALEAIE